MSILEDTWEQVAEWKAQLEVNRDQAACARRAEELRFTAASRIAAELIGRHGNEILPETAARFAWSVVDALIKTAPENSAPRPLEK